ncbi:MAG TPA: GGDEF domain-containing protein [Usitatibacteraceae bacterium]|nr:GGDEF domain-containing protein [Usitatibacteraceae bacterium]
MLRAQFLVLALLSVHVLLGMLCLATSRGERDSPALRQWGWGLVVYAAGLAITIMAFLPRPVGNFAGNSLIGLSSALAVQGVLYYTDRRLNRPAALGGIAATIAVLAVGNFAMSPSMAVNFVAPTVIATAFFTYGAAMLLLHPRPDAVRPARFVALMLVAAILVWWIRLFAMPPLLAEPVDRERLDMVVSSFAIAQILVGVGATFGLFWVEVLQVQATIARMAFNDSLTGLANRRAIVARFEEEAARSSRTGVGFALAVFDIDRFKDVNDTHGHLAGDALLCHVGRLLAGAKRTEDVLGRLGGEEFVVLMCGHQSGGAAIAADRLRQLVAATPLAFDGKELSVTLSGGLARLPEDGNDWDKVFAAADARLYEAKNAGRNRVV